MPKNVSQYARSSKYFENCVYLLGLVIFTFVFVKNAWVTEDAYIAFRSLEQLFAGNGPVWNPHERVQVFTSPLWYFLLVLARILSADYFLNTLVLSLLLCLGMLWVVKHLVNDAAKWLCIVLLLASSKGFFDYTSSGLENPLAYFLLLVFLLYFRRLGDHSGNGTGQFHDFAILMLCFGLLLTCRHDLALLVAPSVGLVCWKQRVMAKKRLILTVSAGMSPFVFWSLFSLFYYGFPFPNTAYAKLHTGIPQGELWLQGLNYLLSSLVHDPVTLTIIFPATILLFLARSRYSVSIACGIVLNLLYVISVAGDFMQGRFLSFAYLVSLTCCFSSIRLPPRVEAGIVIACIAYWLIWIDNPVSTTRYYKITPPSRAIDQWGVADERKAYFAYSSFWKWLRRDPRVVFPLFRWSIEGYGFATSDKRVTVFSNIGMFGYWSGTRKIIIDPLGLSDPFLARLPASRPWRIGHFERPLPDGYLESISSGENHLSDSSLRKLFEEIKLITQGQLWQKERLRTILLINLGCG